MRIAYLITAYKYPHLFKRMFKAIYDRQNLYLVHIDLKSERSFHEEIGHFLSGFPNARMMKSYDWIYGGYSAIQIQLKAMQELLNEDWDFFINLTGQDFPLKTQAFMRDYLKRERLHNFMQIRDMDTVWKQSRFRTRWYFVELQTGSVPLLRRKRVWPLPIPRSYPTGYRRYGGLTWFILNREFCEYLCFDTTHNELKEFLKHTYIPEEEFFHTVIMRSPFKDTVVNDNKRLLMWKGHRILGFYYSRLRTLTMEDVDALIASEAFFARKFDEAVDSQIIDVLESRLIPLEAPSVSADTF
jgi:hypothetical protein